MTDEQSRSDVQKKQLKRLEVFHGDVLRSLFREAEDLSAEERAELAGKAAAYQNAITVLENVDEDTDGLWEAPMSSDLTDDLLERSREWRKNAE